MKKFNYTGPSGIVYPDCYFVTNHYRNGNNALSIYDDEGPVTICSVNAERINASDEIGIKDWSENEGITQFLIDSGIIHDQLIDIEHSGLVDIYYYKLTEKGMKLYNSQEES